MRLWVHAYSNDDPCYIPSERILQEGGYEGGGAMVYYDRPTKFAPGLENKIVSTVHELLPREFVSKDSTEMTAAALPAGDLRSPNATNKRPEVVSTGNPPPKFPTESLATLRTKPGLTVELAQVFRLDEVDTGICHAGEQRRNVGVHGHLLPLLSTRIPQLRWA